MINDSINLDHSISGYIMIHTKPEGCVLWDSNISGYIRLYQAIYKARGECMMGCHYIRLYQAISGYIPSERCMHDGMPLYQAISGFIKLYHAP